MASSARRSEGEREADADPPELRRLRRRIDTLDRRIVRLLNERASLAIAAGAAKAAGGRRTTSDTAREREVLQRVARENGGPLPQADLLAVYRRLISATRHLQSLERDGILGRRRPSSAQRDSNRR